MKSQILLVDDDQPVLDSLRRMLRSQRGIWSMTYVDSGEAAWQRMLAKEFDAVVCDIKMPGLNGLELLQRMARLERTANTPVVMLTGLADHTLKRRALDLGATDLLNKPVEPEDLLARLRNAVQIKSYQDELQAANDSLERKVQERTEELFHSRLDIIWRLAKVAEHREAETGNHVIRVGCNSRLIAEAMGRKRGFVETLFLAAPLHDIGKIGIPDSILLKRGALGPGQGAKLQEHCVIGARILREDSKVRTAFQEWRGADSRSVTRGFDNPFLETAASIALTHHEKWDGTGYPRRLAGEQIPAESRIVAIADMFDVLTSCRSNQEPYPQRKALEIIRDAVGSHFEPTVYEAFVAALPAIRAAQERFADSVEVVPRTEQYWETEYATSR